MTVTNHDHDLQQRLVALTRDLILIPSIPSRPQELKRAFELIKNHLEYLDHIEIREFTSQGFPSLIAAPIDCHTPQILMIGHLDVITHPDISVYRSQIKDGKIYGPGAGDMKGALAIILEVFRAIHSQSQHASLGIAITSDEEQGGQDGIGFLFQQTGISCGQAMIPDGGQLNEITVEEKGIIHLKLICPGHCAHAARPWLGTNPIEILMESLIGLKNYFSQLKNYSDHWHPTCTVTIIGTDNKTNNRIPALASAVLDIRFPPPFTVQMMLNEIQTHLPASIIMEVIISAEPTLLSPDPLYQQITQQITGHPAMLIREDGGSDARYIAAQGIPVLMSRPLVGNLHSEEEWIDIISMIKFYRIYEQYLTRKLL
jgi:succinyl-diaminopimelate desuccinylase